MVSRKIGDGVTKIPKYVREANKEKNEIQSHSGGAHQYEDGEDKIDQYYE